MKEGKCPEPPPVTIPTFLGTGEYFDLRTRGLSVREIISL